MSRSIMLQRLLALGPGYFALVAEAIDLLGGCGCGSVMVMMACVLMRCVSNEIVTIIIIIIHHHAPRITHYASPPTPPPAIEQPDVELCVANCFTVCVLHYALNVDSPSAPRSPVRHAWWW